MCHVIVRTFFSLLWIHVTKFENIFLLQHLDIIEVRKD